MKRVLTLTLAALLLAALLCGVGAAEQIYVIDNAGLLTAEEQAALNEQAARISDEYACSVSILTVDYLDGKSPEAYADDYYDQNGLGYNGTEDGILLLVAMADRDYYITSAGQAQSAIMGERLYTLEDAFLSDLSQGDYYEAFSNFLSQCNYQLAHKDDPMDEGGDGFRDDTPNPTRTVTGGILAAITGFLGSLIPTGVMKSKNNNVAQKQTAANYARPGSLQLSVQNDRYLRTDTSRVRIQTDSGRGYGGGGSSHISSGGVSHTGGGGKF